VAKIDGGTKKIKNIGDKHEIVRSRSKTAIYQWPEPAVDPAQNSA